MKALRKEILHKHEAVFRSKAVQSGVDYDILFNLAMAGEFYEVAVRITFNLLDVIRIEDRVGGISMRQSFSTLMAEISRQ